MNKAASIAGASAGGASIVTGGYFLVKNSIEGSGDEQSSLPNLETFKTHHKNEKCITDVFGEGTIDFSHPTTNPDTIDNADGFFGAAPTEATSDQTKGCLMISYKKNIQEKNKGTGTFVGLWTFVNKDRGFINFNMATKADDQKIKLTGGFYLLEKTAEDPNKGNITWKEEVEESNSKTNAVLQIHLPVKAINGKVHMENKDYWGFGDDEEILTPESPSTPAKFQRGSGVWKKGDTDAIGQWSRNLKDWGENIYDATKEKFKLYEKLDIFKGTGSVAPNN